MGRGQEGGLSMQKTALALNYTLAHAAAAGAGGGRAGRHGGRGGGRRGKEADNVWQDGDAAAGKGPDKATRQAHIAVLPPPGLPLPNLAVCFAASLLSMSPLPLSLTLR